MEAVNLDEPNVAPDVATQDRVEPNRALPVHSDRSLVERLTDFVRAHPTRSVAVGFATGMILGIWARR